MTRFSVLLFVLLVWSCTSGPDENMEDSSDTVATTDTLDEAPVETPIDSAELLIEETDVRDNIIKNNRFGAVMAGMPVMELNNLFAPSQIVEGWQVMEGDSTPIVNVYNPDGSHLLKIFPNGDAPDNFVDMCFLYDSTFVTLDNLGVGSTFDEIKKVYEIESMHTGTEGFFVYTTSMPETAFVFPYLEDNFEEAPQVDQITPDAKVSAIYTYRPVVSP